MNVKVRTADAGSDVTPLVITRVVAGIPVLPREELSATLREMGGISGNQEREKRTNSGGWDDCCGSLGAEVASAVFTSEDVGLEEEARVAEVVVAVEMSAGGEDCGGNELVLVEEPSIAPALTIEVVEGKANVSVVIVVMAEGVGTVVVDGVNERLENVLLLMSGGVCEGETIVSLAA